MNDLAILHLSDLHIDSSRKRYSKLLAKLLDDIRKQIEASPVEHLVLVVTGDVINIGEKKAVSNAKKFFDKLKDIISDKQLDACYIVPGNHDKKRTNLNQILIPAYRSYFENTLSYSATATGYKETNFDEPWMTIDSTKAEDILWDIQKETYTESGYFALIDYIYDTVFPFLSDNNKEVAKRTFGADVITIDDQRYCFVSLNTAWSCIDDKDTRHIILGDFQTKDIMSQFEDLTDEDPADVVIALGHHPIDCLFGVEQDHLFSKMISDEGMNANAYLCGHTHDRNIINWSNTSHTMYTLMTGIGGPDSPGGGTQNHYYSMYTLNMDINSLDIVVRRAETDKQFKTDLSIYTGDEGTVKIVSRPIFFEDTPGAISLTSTDEKYAKTLFATQSILEDAPNFLKAIRRIDLSARSILDDSFQELYECWAQPDIPARATLSDEQLDDMLQEYVQSILDGDDSKEIPIELKAVLEYPDNQRLIMDNFESFIQSLCQIMHEELVSNSQGMIRFHFRYLADKTTLQYPELCASFSSNMNESTENYHASEMKYGDLLEAAFNYDGRKCLIYTVNKHLCTKPLSERWKNFITIIPRFEGNVYVKKINQTRTKEYPRITFGVSTSNHQDDKLLFCMDYFHMDEILGDIIGMFIKAFNIDLDKYFTSVKKGLKEE